MKNKWKEIILVICVSYTVISVCAVIVNTIAGTQNNNFNTIMMLVLTAISVCVLYLYKLFDRFSPLLTITLQYLIALALATAVLLICGLFDEISENGCRDFFVSFTVFYAIGAVVFYMFGIISYKASTELHFFYNQPILTVSGLKICLMVGGFIRMRKKVIGMLTKILIGVIALVIVLLLYFVIVSTGRIREYKDDKGNQLEGSISEKIKIDINRAQNGLFINGKNVDKPVLLFVSSGPGTDDYFLNEKYPDMHIEDEFTVCYWDYRGMGIVYDKNIDPASIDLNTLVEDTAAVTKYLMERFGKEKIYIMAFSGGTNIALKTIEKYPEYYYAYIAMAQVIGGGDDKDTLIYQFMKDTFTERGDKKRLNKLEQIVDKKDNGKVECHDWYEFVALLHEAGGGTTMNETEFEGITLSIMRARCYTLKEKFDYIKGMKMYRTTTLDQELENKDYRKTDLEFDIPVYFISGDHDYNCPWPLVEEYCDMIIAPDKEFYLIENAAHSPLWEQQEVCFEIMKNIKKETLDDGR